MSAAEISQNYVFGLLQSKDQFPVNLDSAWHWLGYSRKSILKEKLLSGFIEGADFCTDRCKNGQRGRSSDVIMLTINCFKELAMMAGTDKGKEVRNYFIDCEEKLKQIGGKVRVTTQQARELANPDLVKPKAKDKVKMLETVERFLDKYPDCAEVVRQIFKD